MGKWRTKRRLAQEMQSLFPHKYTNEETPYRALRRAELGEFVDLNTALCIAAALKIPIDELLDAQVSVPGQEQAFGEQAPVHQVPLPAQVSSPEADGSAAGSAPVPGARQDPPSATVFRPRGKRMLRNAVTVLLPLLVSLVALSIHRDSPPESQSVAGAQLQIAPTLQPRRIGLLVEGVPSIPAAELSRHIGSYLPDSLSTVTNIRRVRNETLLRLPPRFGVDGVAQIETRQRGRYVEFSLSYATPQSLELVWIEALPRSQLAHELEALARRLAARLAAHLGQGEATARAPTGSQVPQAFDAYLRARILLDDTEASSMPSLNRASSLLQSALQRDPQFALAHAAQCETLASLFWVNDHRPYLHDARIACNRARTLAPSHPYVDAAAAVLDIRDGEAEATIAQLTSAIERYPHSTRLRLILAQAHFAVFERRGDTAALRSAVAQLRVAVDMEPDYWSPHFWLGTIAYYLQDFTTALSALQRSVELHPVEVTIANFGTIAMCQDNLDLARQAFEQIERDFPTNHLGPEKLGSIYHFLGDYAREIVYREKGVRLLGEAASPDIHQIHGALANAHRLQGAREEALRHYQSAVEIIQRDMAKQIVHHQDALALALYRSRIAELKGEHAQDELRNHVADLVAGVDLGSLGPAGHVWAAQLYALLERQRDAAQHWAAAVESCPVYRRHPANPASVDLASTPATN